MPSCSASAAPRSVERSNEPPIQRAREHPISPLVRRTRAEVTRRLVPRLLTMVFAHAKAGSGTITVSDVPLRGTISMSPADHPMPDKSTRGSKRRQAASVRAPECTIPAPQLVGDEFEERLQSILDDARSSSMCMTAKGVCCSATGSLSASWVPTDRPGHADWQDAH